jgi:copper transport protein
VTRRAIGVRVASVLLISAVIVGAAATQASAHAVLLQTSPTDGQILRIPPKGITLRYNQPVEAALGAVRLYDGNGRRIDTGAPTKPEPQVVAVPIRSTLPYGAYIVTWRVISADSHPVQGSFTFQVGTSANATAPSVQALAGNLLSKEKGSRTVGVIYGFVRWVVFAALALLVGTVGFVLLLWPASAASKRVRRLAWAGWSVLVGGTVASFLLEGPYGAGYGLGTLWRWRLIDDVLQTHFGHVLVVRLVLLALAVPVLVRVFRRKPDEETVTPTATLEAGAALLGAAVLLTISLAGHADTGNFVTFAVIADWVHLAAMSLWVGGLVVVAVAVLAPRDIAEQRRVVPRFSRLALFCVGALVVSGAYQTWRQVGGLQAFEHTDFGNLLVVKLAIFVVLLVVATRSRSITNYVFGHRDGDEKPLPVISGGADDGVATLVAEPPEPEPDRIDEEDERRRLRRAVAFEAVLAAAILAVSALLVNAQPGRTALATRAFAGGEENVTLKSSHIWVDVTLAPGKVGSNDVHVNTLVATGGLTTPLQLDLTLDLPSKGIAPLDVPITQAGPGHYLAAGVTIPIAGNWRVTARALLTPIDEATLVGYVTILP